MKDHFILVILLSFLLFSSIVFAYSPEQNVNVTDGQTPEEPEVIERPTGGSQPYYNFRLNLLISDPIVQDGDILEAVLEITNEGEYVPGELEVLHYICVANTDKICDEIKEETISKMYTALPGQSLITRVSIKKLILFDPGKHNLIANITMGKYYKETVYSSFLILPGISLTSGYIEENYNTLIIILVPTCIVILLLIIWKYKKVLTRKL